MALNYKNILVGIDGSKGSQSALERAVATAKRNDAHLDILRVLDINSIEYGGAGVALDGDNVYDLEQSNEQYMLDLKKRLVKDGLREDQVNVHLRFGNPKTVIVEDFQPEYHNDLIIVGETGKNLVQRMMMGSVAAHIIRTAKCDVLIAKVGEETE